MRIQHVMNDILLMLPRVICILGAFCIFTPSFLHSYEIYSSQESKKEILMMAWAELTIAHCNDTKLNIMEASNMVLESIISHLQISLSSRKAR